MGLFGFFFFLGGWGVGRRGSDFGGARIFSMGPPFWGVPCSSQIGEKMGEEAHLLP